MERSLARVVLVVDDDPLVLKVTATMLQDLGCEVVTATGANEALDKLCTDRRIEVLNTDINMPGMDGHECPQTGGVAVSALRQGWRQ
jgi:two-component system, cell cycle response regulator CpdR